MSVPARVPDAGGSSGRTVMRFVSVTNMAAWIREAGPENIITGMVDAMQLDFARWERFEREPRVASHSPSA
jgi:ornithine cyclodeaminase